MSEPRLNVFLDGLLAGTIHQDRSGNHTFTYEKNYVNSDNPTPLSLSMPLSSGDPSGEEY